MVPLLLTCPPPPRLIVMPEIMFTRKRLGHLIILLNPLDLIQSPIWKGCINVKMMSVAEIVFYPESTKQKVLLLFTFFPTVNAVKSGYNITKQCCESIGKVFATIYEQIFITRPFPLEVGTRVCFEHIVLTFCFLSVTVFVIPPNTFSAWQ